MNADRLLAHYEKIADAPDAVTCLRRFILDLAVRGKLVPQDAKDEPAAELLKRIASLRSRMVDAGIAREPKKLPTLRHEDQLFAVPKGWLWTRADDLWDFENGDRSTNYPSKDQFVQRGVPFVNAGHLVDGKVSMVTMNFISAASFAKLGGGKLRHGDQVYCLRGSLGKHAVFDHDGDAAIASSLVILRPIEPETISYLARYFDSDIALKMLQRFDNGTARPNLSSANLRLFEVPLPPLAEQRRIIAKVDELMALCDRLDAARAQREATRDRLAAATLARLNTPDPATFQEDARFALDTLPALTTRPDQIKQLRQTILTLAFDGRLIPQQPEDGTGASLLAGILAAHPPGRRFGGRIKHGKAPLDPEGCPGVSAIPSTWQWAYLDCLCEQIADVDHKMPAAVDDGVPFISARDLKDDGSIDFENAKRISEADFCQLSRKLQMRQGDIVYSRIGTIGKARIVDRGIRFTISYSCCLIRPLKAFLDIRYVQQFLESEVALNQARAQPGLAFPI